ncbi:MAG TPA: hypothetical protein VEX86_03455 [Longimicrobium sp.]|nr:hypothetical protein [Longimicrobium sp.]
MPNSKERALAKAVLTEMWPGSEGPLEERNKDGGPAKKVVVQFNPETLKVSFSNQNAGGTQPSGSATQFVGAGTTKLSLELWFDVQLPLHSSTPNPGGDVRSLTSAVTYFMTPQDTTVDGVDGKLPPGVQFQWGTFLFKGTVDSLEESLEYFSEEGKPLRASMSLNISRQDMVVEFGDPAKGVTSEAAKAATAASGGKDSPAPGTRPMQPARDGDTVQAASAKAGVGDWKKVALANGIENPRLVPPGKLLDVSGAVSASAAASLGLSGATAASARGSAGFSASASAGLAASAALASSASAAGASAGAAASALTRTR